MCSSSNFNCDQTSHFVSEVSSHNCVSGRGDGSQRYTPIQEEVCDHSTVQANITHRGTIKTLILK